MKVALAAALLLAASIAAAAPVVVVFQPGRNHLSLPGEARVARLVAGTAGLLVAVYHDADAGLARQRAAYLTALAGRAGVVKVTTELRAGPPGFAALLAIEVAPAFVAEPGSVRDNLERLLTHNGYPKVVWVGGADCAPWVLEAGFAIAPAPLPAMLATLLRSYPAHVALDANSGVAAVLIEGCL